MKIALVSDIHVHNWRQFSEPGPSGVPTRLHDCASVVSEVGDYCIEHGITTLVIGGDVFHKRGVIYTHAYNLVVERLATLARVGLTVLVVDGNHDHADKSGQTHAVQALAEARLVQSIDVAHGWENWSLSSDDDSGELIVTGMSYCDSRATFLERLEQAEQEYEREYRDTSRVFVCHHGFQGAAVGSALEYVVKEDIDIDVFRHATHDVVFSGHYHQRQLVKARAGDAEVGDAGDGPAVQYIGSPLEHMRGDGGTQKGFLVYDSTAARLDLVPLVRPQFVTLTQAQIDAKDYAHVDGNFVDVLYEGLPKTDDEFKALLRKHGARGINLAPQRKRAGPTATRLDVDLSTDPSTLLTKYVKHVNPPTDHEELLRIGHQLLDRASS